jgi:nitroimidazol reductase NimA-like FMN-containing flavoprotein (pyridoxamine 5'-phosphate oxidase superfamily)
VRADGRPHVTPLVAVWLDDAMHFCTGETEQKAMNLRVNRHVVLTTGCNTWTEGLDVVVEGDAVAVIDDAMLSRLATTWSHKWDGRWHYQVRGGRFFDPGGGGDALVFAVAPIRGTPWSRGRMTPWPSTRSTSALSRTRNG